MKNTSSENIENDEINFSTCKESEMKCTTCVWGYVCGRHPTDMCCVHFPAGKPKGVYFKNKNCIRYKPLPEKE